MAIVQVFAGDSGTFKEANLGGILCFEVDRKLRSRFLRLYDLNTSELLFQTEVYVNMGESYVVVRDKFHCFPLLKTVIGLDFANLYDALYFKKLVDRFAFSGETK